MRVYVLTVDYMASETNIIGVFSTLEKANSVKAELINNPGSNYFVDEYEVDEYICDF